MVVLELNSKGQMVFILDVVTLFILGNESAWI